jgi:hypothetical protein
VSLYSQAGTSSLATLYLSQVPYTGLDLGPVGTVVYWLALVGWSLAAAYLVLFGAFPFLARRGRAFGDKVALALNPGIGSAPVKIVMPPPAPVESIDMSATMVQNSPMAGYSPFEGFKSFAKEGALTIEDIVKGLSQIPPETKVFAKDDTSAADTPQRSTPAEENRPQEPAVAAEPRPRTGHAPTVAPQPEPAPAPRIELPPRREAERPAIAAEVPAFIAAVLAGDRETTFGMLREVARSGGDPEAFFTQVACALDDAYRARIEGAPVHPEVKRITDGVATPVLEKVVTAFTTAVDSSYSIGITGAKLALTRALATLGA